MDTLNTRELTQWFTLWISLWWFFDDLHNHFRQLNQEITNLYHNIASGVKTNGLYIFCLPTLEMLMSAMLGTTSRP